MFYYMIDSVNKAIEYERGNLKAKTRVVKVNPVPKFTADEIKNIRHELHLTQLAFAQVMGVSTKTVEAWESGRNIPGGTAQRMLAFLKDDPTLTGKVIASS